MNFDLPSIKAKIQNTHFNFRQTVISTLGNVWPYSKKSLYLLACGVDLALIIIILTVVVNFAPNILKPLISPMGSLQPITESKSNKEVFGFAPFWTFNKLDNVDFNTLTTMAYFGMDILASGDIDRSTQGYETFHSKKATQIFKKAHTYSTKVVLTITQMDNDIILAILDDPSAQENAITQVVAEVYDRGIDGVNIDFEYGGNPGPEYTNKFSTFVKNLSDRMHASNPYSRVTVSVYASAIKEPKLYDIAAIARTTDGIFMMAYDFSVASSDVAAPTAPLYGHKEADYWYDISTAVEDFLAYMPSEKLILGVPWYGYNYSVSEPEVKSATASSWGGRRGMAQTYAVVSGDITPGMEGITEFKSGWDEITKVAWKAYKLAASDTWRMVFIDDTRSLGMKYDFVKEKNLGGVGMWALGFDEGNSDLWVQLKEKFGATLAKSGNVREVLAIEEY